MDMNTDIFADTVYGKIALKKLAPNEPHFRLFEAGWLGDGKPEKREVMEVKGADFREAIRGPNKGQFSIMVPQTTRSVFVTAREMDEFKAVEKNINRQADLHFAFQFGQDAARGNAEAIKIEFATKFAGDPEAQTQFDEGFAGESAKLVRAL